MSDAKHWSLTQKEQYQIDRTRDVMTGITKVYILGPLLNKIRDTVKQDVRMSHHVELHGQKCHVRQWSKDFLAEQLKELNSVQPDIVI